MQEKRSGWLRSSACCDVGNYGVARGLMILADVISVLLCWLSNYGQQDWKQTWENMGKEKMTPLARHCTHASSHQRADVIMTDCSVLWCWVEICVVNLAGSNALGRSVLHC